MLSHRRLEFHKPHRKSFLKVYCISLFYFTAKFTYNIIYPAANLPYLSWLSRKITEGHGRESVQLWNKRRLQTHDDWKAGKTFYICRYLECDCT